MHITTNTKHQFRHSVSSETKLPFQTVQAEFAAHIRDPDLNRGPSDVEPRRMAIYKRLFYDNIESFCANSFKSFRAKVDDEYWHTLVRGFIKHHECATPYFREIPNEFLKYLVDGIETDDRYPFMVELCHYDLVRIELQLAPESIERRGQLASMDMQIQRSPLVRLLSYLWPVHLMDEPVDVSELPSLPTWLIAYRDRRNKVEFLVSNPETVRMLELLDQPQSSLVLIRQLSEELHIDRELLDDQAFKTLKSFVQAGVVVLAKELAER